MKAGAVVFLVFFIGAGLVLFTDLFDDTAGPVTTDGGGDDEAAPKPKPLTVEQRVAALEESAADLRRRARGVGDTTSVLAGTDRALVALQARLAELTASAGNLPREEVVAQLDVIERDFGVRELMVSGTNEVLERGPDEIQDGVTALRTSAGKLRASAVSDAALVARLDKVVGDLDSIAAPRDGSAAKEVDAVKQARARFDKGVAALRARCEASGGSLAIEAGPPALRTALDPTGGVQGGVALDLARELRRRFDPRGTVNPGRWPAVDTAPTPADGDTP